MIKATASHNFVAIFKLAIDRKSTRLNSSHLGISYAVFCLKKKKEKIRARLVELTPISLAIANHNSQHAVHHGTTARERRTRGLTTIRAHNVDKHTLEQTE